MSEGLLWYIKIASVIHHSVQAKNLSFNSYIYILYCELNMLSYLPPKSAGYLYKMKYFICNGGVGTASNQKPWSWQYVTDVTQTLMNKESD